MSKEKNIVIVAAYQSIDPAEKNFDQLTKLVKQKVIKSDGMILVQKDQNGQIIVRETGDHLGRKGAGWGGGVGLLVGLAAPPLLASVVVGAAAGAVVGKFAKHKVVDSLEGGLGDNLKPGQAVILAIVEEEYLLSAQQALDDSLAKSLAAMDEGGAKGLKAALNEARGKFNPDRTILPKKRRFDVVNIGDAAPQAEEAHHAIFAGFGGPEPFGGEIHTPALERVQEMGLTYNAFHVTAVCSPTRAAMLTGRNHHRVGMGGIAEFPGPFPGYTGTRPRSCTALPRILKENGYVTAGFGKWHMTPGHEMGPSGPFEHWPQAWGFDHWWGFLTGAAGQYDPIITQDNSVLGVPQGKDGKLYYFPDDITDKSIEWLHGVRAHNANKPWFLYYSTGATHAPHHVGREWADKYKGQFDDGWDAYRERTLERQKKLGVVPPDTELAPRPDPYPAWNTLSDTEKKVYARQMEVFAGFSENADWNVNRLIDEIEAMGELDNTLIVYIWGDNGASMEGTTTGSFNETTFFNGIVLNAEEQLALIEKWGGIEELGGEYTAPHFAAAWAHANNTPFQWGKQMASHLGGTRDPMVVAWPGRIKPDSQIRSQFTHCIDVAPTILEAIGIPEPKVVDGIEQEPMDGTSFAYTFGDAEAEERHTVQYFEMYGSRAIYKDGWWACARLDKLPWDFSPATLARFKPGSGYNPDDDPWELYYLPDDFSQAKNLSADNPEKLAELKDLFWQEAERNRALPLLGGLCVFFGILPPMDTTTRFNFAGDVQNVSTTVIPRIYGRSYAIEAEIEVPETGAEGVLCAFADFIGGFSLWVDENGHLIHTYQFLGIDTYRQISTEPIPTGEVTVKMLFEIDEPKPGAGGNVTLWANDKQIGEGRMPHSVAMLFTTYAGMDMGRDNGGVVDLDYEDKAPYAFTGKLKNVVFDLKPAHHEAEIGLHEHGAIHAVAAGVAG